MPAGRRYAPLKIALGGVALSVLFAALPLILTFTAIAVASAAGCQLDEGSVHPCLILGVDLGGLLTFAFVLGWATFFTAPLGLVGAIASVIVAGALAFWRRRQRTTR